MTFEPSPPHLRLVAQTDEQAFAQRRASDELSLALRQLTANLMRLARGSGKGHKIAEQCITVLGALEVHQHLVGQPAGGKEIATLLAPDAWDECTRREAWGVAQQLVIRGSLQVAASRLIGQATQAAVGRSQLFEGVAALEKLRARQEAESVILDQAVAALDEFLGEDEADDDEDDLFEPGTFLVREREGGGFLGIFAAESAANLWDMVDEHDDPFQYEFLRVDNGGILFERRPVLNQCPEDEAEAMAWKGPFPGHLITTDELMDGVLDDADAEWQRFDAADVGAGLIARIGRMMGKEESEG